MDQNPILISNNKIEIIQPPEIVFERGELGMILSYEVKRPDGSIRLQGIQKGHSFVKQYIQLWYVKAAGRLPNYPSKQGANRYPIVDTYGVTKYAYDDDTGYWGTFAAGVGVDTIGIVIGTGDTTVAITQYALTSKISHGTGVGALQYSVQSYGAPSATSTMANFVVSRDFTNGSAAPVVIKEAGIYAYCYWPGFYIMIIRDLVNSPAWITLAVAETMALHYKFQTTI